MTIAVTMVYVECHEVSYTMNNRENVKKLEKTGTKDDENARVCCEV